MPGPFRFSPPPLSERVVARPRLIGVLRQRWHNRVTLVIGGAGMGKSTLLAQVLSENALAPDGRDVWLALDAEDADTGFGEDLLKAVCRSTGAAGPLGAMPATAAAISEAVWQLAPDPVCLVLDEAEVLAPNSVGHGLLGDLVRELPENGHLLIAGRHDPGLPVARLAVARSLVRVDGHHLSFDSEELDRIAQARAVTPSVFDGTGGWPAMVELAVSAGRGVAREYLWQEVIEPLGPDRRRVLACLVELGGGDDSLLSAALDVDVDLERDLAGVPLVAPNEQGWYRPHALWQPFARLRLAGTDRDAVLERAVRHLVAHQRFDDAFGVVARSELWREAPGLIRASCVELTRHPPASRLRKWLAMVPDEVRTSAAGQLGAGVLASLDDPDHAALPLRAATSNFHRLGDVEAELGAIAHLGRVAWWTRDFGVLAETGSRVDELAADGYPLAQGLRAIGKAVVADLRGDDESILAALDPVAPGQLGPAWEPAIAWLRAVAHLNTGDAWAAQQILDPAVAMTEDPVFRGVLESLADGIAWSSGGGIDLVHTPGSHHAPQHHADGGVSHNVNLAMFNLSYRLSLLGDTEAARTILDELSVPVADDRPMLLVRAALARASLLVADGHEHSATEVLSSALADHPLDGTTRRGWLDGLALSYVLIPDARDQWDARALQGLWVQSRAIASAVVALRERGSDAISHLAVPELNFVRAHLHHKLAAELAAGLHVAGRSEGVVLLEALGEPGRRHLRTLAAGNGPPLLADAAGRTLAAVPALPPEDTELGILGPITVRRGKDRALVDDDALRRGRVRSLLGFLAIKRQTTRSEVMATLWPDLSDQAARNNLRVNLNHLQRAIEPWRPQGEPGFLLRVSGAELRLVVGPGLDVDADRFDQLLKDAEEAERSGMPSAALDAYRAAIDLWRGELLADVEDADWLDLEREHYRVRYVAALGRAGQLELAKGNDDDADRLGRRALENDPWAEQAHGLIVGAAIARADRSAARRALDRAREAAADLGVEPGPEIQRLARRVEISTPQ